MMTRVPNAIQCPKQYGQWIKSSIFWCHGDTHSRSHLNIPDDVIVKLTDATIDDKISTCSMMCTGLQWLLFGEPVAVHVVGYEVAILQGRISRYGADNVGNRLEAAAYAFALEPYFAGRNGFALGYVQGSCGQISGDIRRFDFGEIRQQIGQFGCVGRKSEH